MFLPLEGVNWSAVSAIGSIAGACINFVIGFSLLISIRALREAEKSRESSVFIWALDQIQEIRPLMRELRAHPDLEWQEENTETVLKVVTVMNMISYMADNDIVRGQRMIDMWGRSIVEQWELLEKFIRAFRIKIGEPETVSERAYYGRHFEHFAARAKSSLNKRFSIRWPVFALQTKESLPNDQDRAK